MTRGTPSSAGHSPTRALLLAGLALSVYLGAIALAWSRATLRDREANSDPLRALASGVATSVYTTTFWTAEARQDSTLWRGAVAACASRPDAVNCTYVASARQLAALREEGR